MDPFFFYIRTYLFPGVSHGLWPSKGPVFIRNLLFCPMDKPTQPLTASTFTTASDYLPFNFAGNLTFNLCMISRHDAVMTLGRWPPIPTFGLNMEPFNRKTPFWVNIMSSGQCVD